MLVTEVERGKAMRMVWNLLQKEKRGIRLYTLVLFVVLAVFFLLVTFFIQRSEDGVLKKQSRAQRI